MHPIKLPALQSGKLFKSLVMLSLALLLSACGYHLRGAAIMPFKTLYIEADNPESPLIKGLRSSLQANHIKLLDKPEKADVILNIASDQTDKQILTLGGTGRVSEYQLHYRVSLRAYDNEQREWLPATELKQSREFPYDDTQILAMTTVEEQLYLSMRTDMIQQILRRLSHAKPVITP